MDSEQTIRDMEANLRKKLQHIPACHKNMHSIAINTTLVVNSNMPSDTFNTAYGGIITVATAKKVFDYYQSNKLPMAWWLGPSSQSTTSNQILKNSGFRFDEHDIGMVCDLKKLKNFRIKSSLSIKACEEAQDFVDFGRVLASIFSPPDKSVEKFYAESFAFAAEIRKDLKLFIGYENNIPVSTASLFLTDVAGIYDISTCPDRRSKGFGSAMFNVALQAARSLGYETGVLQASPAGLNIYQRAGFKKLCDFYVWSNQT